MFKKILLDVLIGIALIYLFIISCWKQLNLFFKKLKQKLK
jgi:hypothetical protein